MKLASDLNSILPQPTHCYSKHPTPPLRLFYFPLFPICFIISSPPPKKKSFFIKIKCLSNLLFFILELQACLRIYLSLLTLKSNTSVKLELKKFFFFLYLMIIVVLFLILHTLTKICLSFKPIKLQNI